MINIFFFLVTIFISLFVLFSVARHDFVLIRQSISLRQVFDSAFIALFVAFIFGRIFFALDSNLIDILNPLKFFHLTRYWGILVSAGFLGAFLSLFFLYKKKKNKLRIFDIYFIAFFPLMVLDIVLKSNSGVGIILKGVSLVVLLAFYVWFLKIHNEFSIKDGFITFLGLISYSLVLLAFSFAISGVFTISHLVFQSFLIAVTLGSAIMLLLIHRDLFNKN